MNNQYSIKTNLRDGTIEVIGEDKVWVKERKDELLQEFKNIAQHYATLLPVRDSGLHSTQDNGRTHTLNKGASRGKMNSRVKSERNTALEEKLTKEVQELFNAYLQERQNAFNSSQPGQAAIIATFLKDNLQIDGVDHNDLYTIYSIMGIKAPANISSQLKNATTRNQYFMGLASGKYRLSNRGENFARFEAKN